MSRKALALPDTALLGALELNADRPLVDVARDLHRKPSSLQRTLKNLIERGVILGKTAVLDVSKLGLIEHGFYLELGPRTRQQRTSFLRLLKSSPGVSWIAEVGGGYDVALNVLARHPLEIQQLFDSISSKFPRMIIRRAMVQRTTRIRYHRGYLGGKHGVRFRMGDSSAAVSLTGEELRVVKALDTLRFESLRDLARREGISTATFTRIVRRLREKQVLLGFGYRLNTDLLGMQQHRILLAFTSLPDKVRLDLPRYAATLPGVKLLLRSTGEWDYELEVDVSSPAAARDLSALFWERYGEHLAHLSVIPIFEHVKFISFGRAVSHDEST